ncbi:MAG: metal ABC transporter permease, partial [Pseudomonadota bacterium]|nr:metal ABC transporter permease [Pseudomonadota bacterium]
MARVLLEEGSGTPSVRPLMMLLPYLWPKGLAGLRLRVVLSLTSMVLAILATTTFPVVMGRVTNALAKSPAEIALASALGLIGAYVLARVLMQAFAQLRDGIFAKVQYHAMREIGVATFAHVHTLSLRF